MYVYIYIYIYCLIAIGLGPPTHSRFVQTLGIWGSLNRGFGNRGFCVT